MALILTLVNSKKLYSLVTIIDRQTIQKITKGVNTDILISHMEQIFQANLMVIQKLIEQGKINSSCGFQRKVDNITVADLTGIATQDIQFSKFIPDNSNEYSL